MRGNIKSSRQITSPQTKTAEEKTEKTQPTLGPWKKSPRAEHRARRRGETVDAIRLLQEALPLATDSSTSDDSDDCSTIGNTSTAESAPESAMATEDFQLPRKRPGTKPATAGDVQPANAALPEQGKGLPCSTHRSTGKGQVDGRPRGTEPAGRADDEGGQHQRRPPHPAGNGSRIPPGRQDRLRAESAVPLLPADGGEAPQGCHPGNLRGDNRGNPETAAPAPKSGSHSDGDERPKAVDQLRKALLRRRRQEHRGKTRGGEAENAGDVLQNPRRSHPPQPAPKKPEMPKPGKPTMTAITKKPVPDVPRTSTARTEPDATSTLAMLIPLFMRINWAKVQGHFYDNSWRADQEPRLDGC
ncbi:hypothetical protein Trydic_g13937 [Trypoxylus dichotomus]